MILLLISKIRLNFIQGVYLRLLCISFLPTLDNELATLRSLFAWIHIESFFKWGTARESRQAFKFFTVCILVFLPC
jgi:hypothetical protein